MRYDRTNSCSWKKHVLETTVACIPLIDNILTNIQVNRSTKGLLNQKQQTTKQL